MKVAVLLVGSSDIYTYDDIILYNICSVMNDNNIENELISLNADDKNHVQDIANTYNLVVGVYHFEGNFIFEKLYSEIKLLNSKINICIVKSYLSYRGCYVINCIEQLISNDTIDYIIKDNCENNIIYLCNNIFRKDLPKVICQNVNIYDNYNCIPSNIDLQIKIHKAGIFIVGSYGCTSNCSFCNNHENWKPISIQKMVDEIEYANQKYGRCFFGIIDSSFDEPNYSNYRLVQFAKELKKRNLNVTFSFNIKVNSYKRIERQIIVDLINVGLIGVFLGCESFNKKDLHLYQKAWNVEDNVNAINYYKDLGLNVAIGIININPYSTIDSLYINNEYLYKLGFCSLLPQIRRVKVFPGTPLYNKLNTDSLLYNPFINSFQYKYIDPKIGELMMFIENNVLNKHNIRKIERELYILKRKFTELISIYKRIMLISNNEKISLLYEYSDKFEGKLNKVNELSYTWFVKILNLMESGQWNIDRAEELTYTYLIDKIINKIEELNMLKYKIYKICYDIKI